ncbi:MAG: DUF4349 domain-containing protein [Microbacterium sp.]|uniref:DUF4349 domain-containing protein n=1 Tax=Microbacterium sp. TaxID=51671 RepID=UPI003A880F13
MNTDHTAAPPPLPELSDERIGELEEVLFAGIAREREAQQALEQKATAKRMRRRRVIWTTTAAAAVVLVGAAALGPTLGAFRGTSLADSAIAPAVGGPVVGVPEPIPAVPVDGSAVGGLGGSDSAALEEASADASAAAGRDMIATAQAMVRVDDVAGAAERVARAAEQRGGFVESMSIGGQGVVGTPVDGEMIREIMPYPVSNTWVTVRVPADELTATIDDLTAIGTVETSSITRNDVTEQTVDLRARIDALEASVTRLTELMGQAGSVGDLLTAESELSQRQAELASAQQWLQALENQVALSSLTVSLLQTSEVIVADPAGFGDGLAAGWNGLVATLNGLVVGLGFLLPWLGVAGVIALIVWWGVRLRRRARAAGETSAD